MNARIWFHDRLVSDDEAAIDPTDRGLTLADGCFDTALVINGTVFCGDRHLDRLSETCKALKLPMPRERLAAAQAALAGEIANGSVRLTVTRGAGARGLALPQDPKPTLFGTVSPLNPQLMFKPMRLAIAETRRNETSITSRLKTLSYLDAVMETDRAKGLGVDEPLFLNTQHRIACSALANIFLIDGHDIVTPPLEEGVLDGVMRRVLMDEIARAGQKPRVTPLPFDRSQKPRFLLTNSLRLVAPASLVGGPSFTKSERDLVLDLMDKIASAIRQACGTDPRDLGAKFPDLAPAPSTP